MSRKPLVKFETSERATLVSANSSMPPTRRAPRRSKPKKSTKGKPRVKNGRVALRVAGYSGLQHLTATSLIPYLPVTKLRQAAKKALAKTKTPKKTKKRRKTAATKQKKQRT